MKRFSVILAGTIGVLSMSTILFAQVFLNPIQVVDIESNGTKLHFFSPKNLTQYLNFQGGAKYNLVTKELDVGPLNGPDRPDCGVQVRDEIFCTAQNPDAGTADAVDVCLKGSNGSYAWHRIAP